MKRFRSSSGKTERELQSEQIIDHRSSGRARMRHYCSPIFAKLDWYRQIRSLTR